MYRHFWKSEITVLSNSLSYTFDIRLFRCTLALLLTEVGKVLVGELRPHFFDVCQPDTAINCTEGEYVNTYQCTVTKYSRHFMKDTARSFPSGHSSLSVYVAVYWSVSVFPFTIIQFPLKYYFYTVCHTKQAANRKNRLHFQTFPYGSMFNVGFSVFLDKDH